MNEQEIQIEKVAEEYIKNNDLSREYGKVADELKTKLKEYIPKHDMKPIPTEQGTVKLSYRTSDYFKDDILIEKFKNDPVMRKAVRTKEYIDYGILESLMYHDEVSEEMLDIIAKNKVTKKTAVLMVKETKKGD